MNQILKLIILLLSILCLVNGAFAAGGGGSQVDGMYEKMNVQVSNSASLQRGAKYFVNYCLSCHSASHSRYKRVAADLNIPAEMMKENMIFTGQKLGDLMTVSMRREDAKNWFLGIDPPDLSTHVRAIGPQAVYKFLKSYYVDDSRPFGVNNGYLPNTAMPHVLFNLQGGQKAVFKDVVDESGVTHHKLEKIELIQPGQLSEEEYDQVVVDIVNFLAYISEPAQLVRKKWGIIVLFFLSFLGILTYFLKRNYWQDVH